MHIISVLFQELTIMEYFLCAKSPLALSVAQISGNGGSARRQQSEDSSQACWRPESYKDHTAFLPGVSSWRHQMLWQDSERCHL